MPILVKHSGNAAPTLWGAYAGGQGRRWAEDARLALNRIFTRQENEKQRAFHASQAALSRAAAEKAREDEFAFRSQEADEARAYGASQAADHREYMAWQNEKAQWYRDRDAARAREHADAMALRQHDWQVDAADQTFDRQKGMIDYGIDAKQRAEFNQLSEAYQDAAQSGQYSDEDLAEFKRQIIAKQAGITTPMPKLKKQSPWPEGQDVGQTWLSDDGRFHLGRDKDGKVYKIGETNVLPTMKDIAGLYEQGHKALTRKVKGADGLETDQAPTPQEVEAWVDRAVQMHRKYAGGAQPAGEEATQDFDTFLRGAVEAKNPPPAKPTVPAGADATQIRALRMRHEREMQDWEQSIAAKLRAAAGGAKASEPETTATSSDEVFQIRSEKEYEWLPEGALFIGPDGKTRRKGGRAR